MSRKCQLTGKKTTSGQNRPFSLKATKRTFRPNLFRKRMLNPLTGKVERMRLSAKAIRTLKKWARESMPEDKKAVENTGPVTKNEEKNRVKKVKLTPKQKKELKAKEEEQKIDEAAGVKEEKQEEVKEDKKTKTTKEEK